MSVDFAKWELIYRKKPALPFKRVQGGNIMERKDCTVLALSQATPLSYDEAHELLRLNGRRSCHGFNFPAWMNRTQPIDGIKFIEAYDWIDYSAFGYTDMIAGPVKTKNLTLGQFIKSKPAGNYIVITKGHAFAVIDGVIHDRFCKGQHCIVQKIYKVEMA